MQVINKNKILSFDIFTYDCNGCARCIKHCKRDVLKIIDNGYCQYAIVQNIERCNACGKCLKACKTKAMQLVIKECS